MPLHWVVVHPITENSPLSGLTAEALAEADPEIVCLISADDETFAQTVHAKTSYDRNDITWGARFRDMYLSDTDHVAIDIAVCTTPSRSRRPPRSSGRRVIVGAASSLEREGDVRARTLLVTVLLGLASASPLLAGQNPALHPGEYAPADIAYGARIYDAQCTTCHGANGDGVGGVDLKSGKYRNAVTDQDLIRVITTGVQGTGMQAFRFDPSEITGIISYLRNMTSFDRGSVKPGDAGRGKTVFDSKGACARCHRVGMQGSHVAPDLSDVGAARGPASLMRSLTEPTSQMMPINRPIRIVTRDGKTINGRRLNEDTYTVQLIDDQEKLVSLTKSDLREYTILTASPMPSFTGTLSADELNDVVAYLLSLKGR